MDFFYPRLDRIFGDARARKVSRAKRERGGFGASYARMGAKESELQLSALNAATRRAGIAAQSIGKHAVTEAIWSPLFFGRTSGGKRTKEEAERSA